MLDRLMAAAVEKTGLEDFGDPHVREPLAAWAEELGGATLNPMGAKILQSALVRDLVKRLRIVDFTKKHPAIDAVEIPPIVLITGFARTGTTLLHNLMALHPKARALLRWELVSPLPRKESATDGPDPRIAKVQAAIETLRGSPLERLHWVNADEPEECVHGYFDTTGVMGQVPLFVCPALWRWHQGYDGLATFREYRQLLQLLLWQNPPPEGGFLLLKAPQTAPHLRAFQTVFPEARFVITHRDPHRAIVSSCEVVDAGLGPLCNGPQPPMKDDGGGAQRMLQTARKVFRSIRERDEEHPERFVHVVYEGMMDDAIASVESVYSDLGCAVPEALRSGVRAFLAEQRQGKRGAPPAHYDERGYTRSMVWDDPEVHAYHERYRIEPELQRRVDTNTGP